MRGALIKDRISRNREESLAERAKSCANRLSGFPNPWNLPDQTPDKPRVCQRTFFRP